MKNYININEGLVKKGGLNPSPSGKRPPPPVSLKPTDPPKPTKKTA